MIKLSKHFATIGVGVLAIGLGPTAPVSAGVPACTYDSGTKRVTIVPEAGNLQVTISRVGDEIQLVGIAVDCGDATVFNTNKIIFDDTDGNETTVIIAMDGGKFRPGFRDEPGQSDEIEFEINTGDGADDRLYISGSNGEKAVTAGLAPNVVTPPIKVNLNSDETTGVD